MSSSDAFSTEKYEALPRPERWMPGPPAPWSNIIPDQRRLKTSELRTYIYKQNQKDFALNEIALGDLPEEAIEELGDNDMVSRPSAVLVPFILRTKPDEIDSVIVMTRTMTVSHHKGQVSFPGGMAEVYDEDIVHTALRETEEEIGIARDCFEVIGTRAPVHTRSRKALITPVIATCDASIENHFSINSDEVETLHVIPVSALLARDAYMSEIWDFPTMSATVHMYFVYDKNDLPVFIWGATAHILTDLLHCLNSGTFH